jgi:hypothetical protein
MADGRIFLSTPGSGISRAVCSPDGVWQVETLLPGLRVSCLATRPRDHAPLYAGTYGNGVLKSDDLGETWQPAGLAGTTIKALEVSPHDPDTAYAGCRPVSMFVTRNGGDSWEELVSFRRVRRWWMFSPAEPGDLRAYVQAISVSPANPQVILAGIELGAVVRSEDGGQSWSGHLKGSLRDCHTLKFHPHDGGRAYEAGGTGGGASFSLDGGRTWQKAKEGLAKNYGVACGSDPERPDIWYVSVAPSPGKSFREKAEVYLYRSKRPNDPGETSQPGPDGAGSTWEPIGWEPHPMSEMPMALVTDPDTPGRLYAGLGYGDVWQSEDYGDSWGKLPFNLGGIWSSLVVLRG